LGRLSTSQAGLRLGSYTRHQDPTKNKALGALKESRRFGNTDATTDARVWTRFDTHDEPSMFRRIPPRARCRVGE